MNAIAWIEVNDVYVNTDDFFEAEPEAAPGQGPVTEPAQEAAAVPPTLARPRRGRSSAVRYTPEQKEAMKRAATIEHYMTVVTSLMFVLPVVAGLWFLINGGWVNVIQGLLSFSVTGLFALIFIKHVQETPKQVGLRVWFGGRIPYLVQEGYRLVIPLGIWDLIRIDVTDKNTDLSQNKVMTKDGIVSVAASMTWHVDYRNPFSVIRYADAGGVSQVEEIFDDPAEEGIRIHAIGETTDEAQADKAGFRDQIIESLGKTEDKTLLARFKNGETKHFVLKNVGIEIIQLTVPDVMLPDEAIKRKQEIVNEKYDKEKESIERDHNIESMQKIRTGSGLEPLDVAEFWLISQDKVKKDVHEEKITVSGMEKGSDPLGLAVPLQLLSRGMSGQGGKGKKGGKGRDQTSEDNEE